MKNNNSLIFQAMLWLFVFCYPLLGFHDRIREPIFVWLWHPFTLIYPLVFVLVFYGNWKVFIPRFLETNRIDVYLLCFLASLATIIWIRPLDRWIFRNGDRLPPWHKKGHLANNLYFASPSGEDFFLDRTSIGIFLLLWLLGLGIWFYQKKLKPLASNFSKLMDLEKAVTTATNPIENIEEDKQLAPANAAPELAQHLTVHVEYEQIKIPFVEIEYIEAFDSYVKIYLSNIEKPLLTRLTLRAVSEKLPPEKFVRIHRSFIVSTDKAAAWTASKVRLKSGQELPVGRSFKGDFNL
jgi:LytTr DNA-binding domain